MWSGTYYKNIEDAKITEVDKMQLFGDKNRNKKGSFRYRKVGIR